MELVAQWMSLGFIHGVMNTDNTSISGETIDYGPCAMMDAFHPDCVFSSIDVNGRYAWGNQPNIAHWNLTRLAETLLPLFDTDNDKAITLAESALSDFSTSFSQQYMSRFRAKFGLKDKLMDKLMETTTDEVLQDGLSLIANQQIDFTLFFRRLTLVASGDDPETLSSMFNDKGSFESWLARWRGELDTTDGANNMRVANPILIPRNHRVEQAIQRA